MHTYQLSLRQILVVASSPQLVWGWHCRSTSPLYTADLQTSVDGLQEDALCTPNVSFSPSTAHAQGQAHHGPWTYAPVCTPILPGLNDTLCVYTNASFGNHRGISLFTTPSLARTFAALPAFGNPSALVAQAINTPTHAYHATPIAGKGLGMLASQRLEFGDRVTAYTPALVAYLESELSTRDREIFWRVAIEQLPSALKDAFRGLATVYGDERVRVQDIVKANTFQLVVGGVNHLAVWPETSRLNHACAPNAQYVIDPELLTHVVRVTRPIAAGDEITISYTSPLEQTATRQQHLQHGFHFTCTCRRCASPASDAALSDIMALQAQLNDWSPQSAGSPAMAEQLLALYRDEGLEGFMDMAYGFAALAYSAVGDASKAVLYAEKARQAILMKDGRWSSNLRIWDSLIGDLHAHWSWRRRL